MNYPDGSVHEFRYDGVLGRLEEIREGADQVSVAPFVKDIHYNRAGVVTRMEYSNLTSQEWEFDNRKRISRIEVRGSSGVIEELRYKLNGVGDIVGINDNEYEYDGFDRVAVAKTLIPGKEDKRKVVAKHFGTYNGGGEIKGILYDGAADLNGDGRINGTDHMTASLQDEGEWYDRERFGYDRNGNRTELVQNGDEYRYEYGERNRLERIYKVRGDGTGEELYIEYYYDANGNMEQRNIHTEGAKVEITLFEYDGMNRLVRTTEGGEETRYNYDDGGRRVIKEGAEGIVVYIRDGQGTVGMDIEIPAVPSEYKGKVNRYVLSGELIAGRVTKTINGDNTTSIEKSWYHLDHVNSTKVVTDELGEVEVRYEYRAFGEQLSKLGTEDAKYTYSGKELDTATNLYYFEARYYDASIGRFISEDPAQDGTNWYVYARNNPLKYIDPWGLADVIFDFDTETITFEREILIPSYSARDEITGIASFESQQRTSTYPARNDVIGEGHEPLPRGYRNEIGYAGLIESDPRFGEYYIDTGDPRGRDIHGGGSGLQDPYAPRQGWEPTYGCIRMQNEDISILVSSIQEYRETHPGEGIGFKVTRGSEVASFKRGD